MPSARPTQSRAPQVLIGPIGPRDARPTFEPPAAADFLASAPAGAVLVSFGSVPFFANALMGRADFDALVGAFADMAPLRVLWLLKRTNLPDGMTYDDLHLAENTQVQEWVVSGAPGCTPGPTPRGTVQICRVGASPWTCYACICACSTSILGRTLLHNQPPTPPGHQ